MCDSGRDKGSETDLATTIEKVSINTIINRIFVQVHNPRYAKFDLALVKTHLVHIFDKPDSNLYQQQYRWVPAHHPQTRIHIFVHMNGTWMEMIKLLKWKLE